MGDEHEEHSGGIDWDRVQRALDMKRKKGFGKAPKAKPKSGKKLGPYKRAYETTRLEKFMAKRGEAAAGKINNQNRLASQRGRVMITAKDDHKRAQVSTQKTFDGIDVVDNYIPYDKNFINEPITQSMAASFGNFQEAAVRNQGPVGGRGIRTYSPCPI